MLRWVLWKTGGKTFKNKIRNVRDAIKQNCLGEGCVNFAEKFVDFWGQEKRNSLWQRTHHIAGECGICFFIFDYVCTQ